MFAPPANLRQTYQSFQIGSSYDWQLSKAHTDSRFMCDFQNS